MCPLPLKQKYTQRYGSLVDFSPLDRGGKIVNSEDQENENCRGARARWCDFSGPLGDGSVGGIGILDHPSNPRHPTPWHNWNNMTITASFTFHEPFRLKQEDLLSLTYRVAVHPGNAEQADVEGLWREFAVRIRHSNRQSANSNEEQPDSSTVRTRSGRSDHRLWNRVTRTGQESCLGTGAARIHRLRRTRPAADGGSTRTT